MKTTREMLAEANRNKTVIASLSESEKNAALEAMAQSLIDSANDILKSNACDLQAAAGKISEVMLDRLSLSKSRIESMASGIRDVVKLPDPVGRVIDRVVRPNGLVIEKTAVPLGVVAIIYESRPNVTSDAAALCLKSGNVAVLRSGKEAFLSAKAVLEAMRRGLESVGLPRGIINLCEDTSRESAKELMTAVGQVDLLIPRGGKGLISACVRDAKVPCIETGTGICHVFVDESADLNMALNIIENAKTSRPSVCNAEEVCLVHEAVAKRFLPLLRERLVKDRLNKGIVPVELRLCEKSAEIISGTNAGENDFDTEFLDYILAIKIVPDVKAAIEHIAIHSTGHSDAIITENEENALLFTRLVDSAAVYVNASTRYTDGGEFGLGCEMGISTQKLHARGPMGLRELCTCKYIIHGNGQIR